MKQFTPFILALIVFFEPFSTMAKKVKFSVDMTGQTMSSDGVHIAGSFQVAAGYASDWNASATPLTIETGNIYSIIVDIPAFHEYEYKFINGNIFYDVEFVPVESRVLYGGNDDRWIYVDSLNNDTLDIGAILYSGNAPTGKKLLRLEVNMQSETVSSEGVHVEGSFQGINPATTRMYSFDNIVYQHIAYVNDGTYQYKYVNGNTSSGEESVPSSCATSGFRTENVTADIVLDSVCFSSCSVCGASTAVAKVVASNKKLVIAPNPAQSYLSVSFDDNSIISSLTIISIDGKQINYPIVGNQTQMNIQTTDIAPGLYYIYVTDSEGQKQADKIVIQ